MTATDRSGPTSRPRIVAVVPARNEEATIGPTVKALIGMPGLSEVVVVADGCTDRTAEEARRAGGQVLVAPDGMGKGRAVESALGQIPGSDVWLFVDGDVGETAREAEALLRPVLDGRADLAVGALPSVGDGGFGLVKRFARWGIGRLTGFRPREPLSGQRAVRAGALDGCRPLAPRFGLETAMTIDALRLGYGVVEVPVRMRHRPTGKSVAGFVHRGRQGIDVLLVLVVRAVGAR
jgi:glycosyltransferase involved in cell wall biosynthesis